MEGRWMVMCLSMKRRSCYAAAIVASAARAANDIARLRMCAQELLQCGVAFVVEMQRQLPGELRCLNEQYILTLRKLRIFEKRCPNLQRAMQGRRSGLGERADCGCSGGRPSTPHRVSLYRVNVARRKRPRKEVEAALIEAEAAGWTVVRTSSAHRWGVMRCPEASRSGCPCSIWSTPRNSGNHARHLLRMLRNCPHRSAPSEDE